MPLNFEIPLAFAHTKKIIKNSSIDLVFNDLGQFIPIKFLLLVTEISATFSPL